MPFRAFSHVVRMKGLEPPRRETPDPKSGAATNYATSALFNIFYNYADESAFADCLHPDLSKAQRQDATSALFNIFYKISFSASLVLILISYIFQ